MSTRQVLYIALLGLGLWGCRTPRGMLQAKEGQAPSYLCEGKETASVAYASSGAAG